MPAVNLPADINLVGIDVSHSCCVQAARAYARRGWRCICARGEQIPLPSGSIDVVASNVALPYMNIPRALEEIHRVLRAHGTVRLGLHHPLFTSTEFRNCGFRPKAALYRVWVLLNGLYFHVTGKVLTAAGKSESCQTARGMRLALARAGFTDVQCRRDKLRFVVEARKASARVIPFRRAA